MLNIEKHEAKSIPWDNLVFSRLKNLGLRNSDRGVEATLIPHRTPFTESIAIAGEELDGSLC